jgi:hypothetical protein
MRCNTQDVSRPKRCDEKPTKGVLANLRSDFFVTQFILHKQYQLENTIPAFFVTEEARKITFFERETPI